MSPFFQHILPFQRVLQSLNKQRGAELQTEDVIASWIFVRLTPVLASFEDYQKEYIDYFDTVFEILSMYLDALDSNSSVFLKSLGLSGQFLDPDNVIKVANLVQIDLEPDNGEGSAVEQVFHLFPPNEVAAFIFLSLLQATYICVETNETQVTVHISKVFKPLFQLLIGYVDQAMYLLEKYQESDRYECLNEWCQDYLLIKKERESD